MLTKSIVAVAAAFALSAPACAGLITFEGKTGFADATGEFIDVDGYRFTLSSVASGLAIVTNQTDLIESTQTKLFAGNHSIITMTRVGGGAFDLLSLDIAGSWVDPASSGRWADTVLVSSSAGTETATLLGAAATYQNMAPNFLNVGSVNFTPTSSRGAADFEFVLDNLDVRDAAVVPVPSTLALIAGAFLAWGLQRRRPGSRVGLATTLSD